jgi:hypothetical protein
MKKPVRDYKQEYLYQGTSEQKHNRALRNAARRDAERRGIVHKGDGKDIDHRVPISKGGTNARSNQRVASASDNRSFPRTSTGAVKKNI